MRTRKVLCGMWLGLFLLIPTLAMGQPVIAINCGGDEYTDGGITYIKDAYFTGGTPYSTDEPIAGTSDQPVYQTERFGTFSYNIPVPEEGWYLVTLKFAEIYKYYVAPGTRVFDVVMEGRDVIMEFDLFSWAGGKYKAFDARVPVYVKGGTLDIEFFGDECCLKCRKIVKKCQETNFTADSINSCIKKYLLIYPTECTTGVAKVNGIVVEKIDDPFVFNPDDVVFAVNSGGSEFTNPSGITYEADKYYTSGLTYSTTENINADENPIYQTERWGEFCYSIPIENGTYKVVLKFAEIYKYIYQGGRNINVEIEGKTVLADLDLYAKYGKYKPFDFIVPFPVEVKDGKLDICFNSERCCLCTKKEGCTFSGVKRRWGCCAMWIDWLEKGLRVCKVGAAKVSGILVLKEEVPPPPPPLE
jgi:hypothetical protein